MSKLGKYLIFLGKLFTNPEKFRVYVSLVIQECMDIGINSLLIVTIVASFLGAVTCVQTAANMDNPFVPQYIISLIVRDSTLLELGPTITCVVLSGKVGSSIAGQLGTMRITEQIDALEVMGINSQSYLVLPKILASVITFPMLVTLACFLGIYGGYIAGWLTGAISPQEYIHGIQFQFKGNYMFFALVKSVVFAFLIASIASFQGFYTKGGAYEVGKASTAAVTNSCIAVLIADYLLAQLLVG
ncbi:MULTISPECIES: MlaE family ABC transporter permease [Aquirufa]|uniref:Protein TRIGALACTOSYLDIACYLGLYCEROL 1, chloroplastic n=2 Tax=Aquirufa TaxID=2676247 RepID=A0A2S2DUT3_9BACT|nr:MULTISPECIES: ABC transporter permease [Aquirufa]AWL08810.1 Protein TRIGALACTOSYLDIACYLGLYCEROL 1, chloroplastic [Aquirufa nivalisilvae]MBZ1325858.1 ABC transporter permease [Aquirufa aurantiipilula]MCZ2479284.1 ABC transporter permease [Aquirufa nivalisilvae]MDF5691454.1 ABC transporter permease [Aquirufa aurantiipilula]TBH74829.1 ABC transporter permease [Aquirufa nivalisilvae]